MPAIEHLRRFVRERRGAIAVVLGVSLSVIVGGSAIGMDIGSWYHTKRLAQSAADAAAYAGALDLARQGLNGSAVFASIDTAAQDAADRNDFDGVVAINNPPLTGPSAGDANAVEAILTIEAPLYLSSIFVEQAPQVVARSVARAIVSNACVWVLDPVASGALSLTGSANAIMGCGVVVNSDHPTAALDQTGSSCLSSTSISINGGSSGDCLNPTPEDHTALFGDPFADLAPPPEADDPCDHASTVEVTPSMGTVTLSPGVYCGGMELKGTVVFEPGNYVVRGGSFKITSQGDVTNNENAFGGVSFYLTGSGTDYASLSVDGGAQVDLTPTTSGSMANVLFYQDPAAPSTGTNELTGGSTMDLTGILYFPNQSVDLSGGTASDDLEVLLAARTLTFVGNSYINSDYAADLLPEEYYARLVE